MPQAACRAGVSIFSGFSSASGRQPSIPSESEFSDLDDLLKKNSPQLLHELQKQHAAVTFQLDLNVLHLGLVARVDQTPQRNLASNPSTPRVRVLQEVMQLKVDQTYATAAVRDANVQGKLEIADFRAYDCCTDPGVRECVLSRLQSNLGYSLMSRSGDMGSCRDWRDISSSLPPSTSHNLYGQQWSPAGPAHAGSSTWRLGDRVASAVSSSAPFISFTLEQDAGHSNIAVELQPMQMVYRPKFVAFLADIPAEMPADTLAAMLLSNIASLGSPAARSKEKLRLLAPLAPSAPQRISVSLPAVALYVPSSSLYGMPPFACVWLESFALLMDDRLPPPEVRCAGSAQATGLWKPTEAEPSRSRGQEAASSTGTGSSQQQQQSAPFGQPRALEHQMMRFDVKGISVYVCTNESDDAPVLQVRWCFFQRCPPYFWVSRGLHCHHGRITLHNNS